MNQSYHQNPSWLKGASQTPNNFWVRLACQILEPTLKLNIYDLYTAILKEVYTTRYVLWKIICSTWHGIAYPSFIIAFREFPSLFTYVQRFVSECYVDPKKVLQDFMYSVVLLWLIWWVIIFRVMCII